MTRLLLLAAVALPILFADDAPDLEVVNRIRTEAFDNSEVMEHLFHLVDVNGPRITNSPGFHGAADWAVGQLGEWGLVNAKQEKWGPFGQGWSREYFSAHLVEPGYEQLIGVPLGWSPSTNGRLTGTPTIAVLKRERTFQRDEQSIDEYIAEWKGKLGGALVMIAELRKLSPQATPSLHRWSDEELAELAQAEPHAPPIDFLDPELEIPEEPEARRNFFTRAPAWYFEWRSKESRRIQSKLNAFLVAEGVKLVIHPARGDGGTVFPPRAGNRFVEDTLPPPSIALTPEHYNRIYRLLDKGVDAKVEVEVRTTFYRDDLDSINVIAEIPGGSKADELIMLGGHLDSTAAALGATDNGAGCAVMLEAVRILKKLDLPLARTVRIALWGGEEQGLLGSTAYVKEHFGDPETMKLTARHEKFSGYFNVDNGTGKIRGVYLQGNDRVRPIFEQWLVPFHDLGAATISIRNTGGTDHLPFNDVGLPGFQFIQDRVEYETRTHHSNMDNIDRIQPGDLIEASAIVATFIYHAANRAEPLPRKPLPAPQPLEKPEQ
jgi:carboxypeptidase Q